MSQSWFDMRSASAASVTPLLGSLALHACAVLVLLVAVRKPSEATQATPERADAWQGNAVEVDAVATPDTTPNIANAADAPSESTTNSSPNEARASEPEAPPPAVVSHEASEPATRTAPPRVRPKRRPKPPAAPSPDAPSEAANEPSSGSHEANSAAATGTFGAEGLPIGVRSLPSAFARAIPPATGADPIWQTLAVGTQPPFTMRIHVDAEGHISEAKLLGGHEGQEAPAQFTHLRDRVIALLGGGLFALQNDSVSGTDLFRITITLSDRAVKADSEPAELVERGFEPPRGSTPGRAYFTLASGRHFEAKIEVLGAPARANHP